MSQNTIERRSHARFRRSVEVRGTAEPGKAPIRMVSRDLSLGGVYCTCPADFPEMTRLAVRLLLPARGRGASEVEPLDLEAAVVRRTKLRARTDPPRYELALFFTSMSDSQRRRLARFLAEA